MTSRTPLDAQDGLHSTKVLRYRWREQDPVSAGASAIAAVTICDDHGPTVNVMVVSATLVEAR